MEAIRRLIEKWEKDVDVLTAKATSLRYVREAMTSLYYSEMDELTKRRWEAYRSEEDEIVARRNFMIEVAGELRETLAISEREGEKCQKGEENADATTANE